MRNIGLYTFMIPVGLSSAAGYLVGNQMGKGRIDLANKAFYLCWGLTLIWAFASVFLVYIGQEKIIGFYTNRELVKESIRPAWYILSLFTFFDCMQIVDASTIGGLGMVKKIKYSSLISYWIFGIPIAFYLAIHLDMKLEGLWYGPTIACALNFLQYEVIIRKTSWEKIANEMKERMENEKKRDEAVKLSAERKRETETTQGDDTKATDGNTTV